MIAIAQRFLEVTQEEEEEEEKITASSKVEALERLLKDIETCEPGNEEEMNDVMLPRNVLESMVWNSLGGAFLDMGKFADARKAFLKSIQCWDENSMALLNMGNLELEHGAKPMANAIHYYQRLEKVCSLESRRYGRKRKSESQEWRHSFWMGQWQYCVETGLYRLAILYHAKGKFEKGKQLLERFGFKHRLSPNVWRSINTVATAVKDRALPVQLFAKAIPCSIVSRLRNAFSASSSPFWRETDYEDRGYFSFWYSLEEEPRNVIECLIRHLLETCLDDVRGEIVGAEWWLHTRPAGRNFGHQLHFDMEEEILRVTGETRHPLVSSVCYLDGEVLGGPTLVLDQTKQDIDNERYGNVRGWLAQPTKGGFLRFPGDRYHGVLPGSGKNLGGSRPVRNLSRLTLMIGFWEENVNKIGIRYPLGPCSSVPKHTRSTTWPSLLDLVGDEAKLFKATAESKQRLPVQEISDCWEKLGQTTNRNLRVPQDANFGFFRE